MNLVNRAVRGMRDIMPGEMEKISMMMREARRICNLYGYREVVKRCNILEKDE
jgi:histidyl-tRNA synthetase